MNAREILKGESTGLVGNLMWEDRKWVACRHVPRWWVHGPAQGPQDQKSSQLPGPEKLGHLCTQQCTLHDKACWTRGTHQSSPSRSGVTRKSQGGHGASSQINILTYVFVEMKSNLAAKFIYNIILKQTYVIEQNADFHPNFQIKQKDFEDTSKKSPVA